MEEPLMTNGAKQLAQMFAGPTQKDIAKRLKIGQSYLSLLIAGKRTPSMALAGKIEREIGIPVGSWAKAHNGK